MNGLVKQLLTRPFLFDNRRNCRFHLTRISRGCSERYLWDVLVRFLVSLSGRDRPDSAGIPLRDLVRMLDPRRHARRQRHESPDNARQESLEIASQPSQALLAARRTDAILTRPSDSPGARCSRRN